MNANLATPGLRLHELALGNGLSASPFVWRTRFALAHKGLRYESEYLGFIDIPKRFGGRFKTVPVLEHGDTVLADSWDIAEYLEGAFPEAPPIFGSAAELALVRLTEEWFTQEVMRRMFRIYLKDVHDAARPADQAYFRQSREQGFLRGRTLESFTADRAAQLPALRDALRPLRAHVKRHAFLGGSSPNYADYIVLGAFLWVAGIHTLPLLAADDPLRSYLDRGFDLYAGLARDPRMKSLFE